MYPFSARCITAGLALLLALLSLPGSARSQQPASNETAAQRHYFEGLELMKKGDYVAACARFEQSLEHARKSTPLLNLANCFEQRGMLASAWEHYREAADIAAEAKQPDLEDTANKRAAALEPRLTYLVIRVSQPVPPGITVSRNRRVVKATPRGVAVPVDPGEHEVIAEAPGYRRYAITRTAVESATVMVEIPPLKAAEDGGADRDRPIDTGAEESIIAPLPAKAPGNARRRLGLVIGGTGIAAIAVGLGFGGSALLSWNAPFDSGECSRETRICSLEGQQATDRARLHASIATVATATGVATLVAGVALYVSAPSESTGRRASHIVAMASPDSLGLAMVGRF